jgi:hypothetical protein
MPESINGMIITMNGIVGDNKGTGLFCLLTTVGTMV